MKKETCLGKGAWMETRPRQPLRINHTRQMLAACEAGVLPHYRSICMQSGFEWCPRQAWGRCSPQYAQAGFRGRNLLAVACTGAQRTRLEQSRELQMPNTWPIYLLYVYEVHPVAFLFCLVAPAACSICSVHFPAYDSANLLFAFFCSVLLSLPTPPPVLLLSTAEPPGFDKLPVAVPTGQGSLYCSPTTAAWTGLDVQQSMLALPDSALAICAFVFSPTAAGLLASGLPAS